MYFFYDITEFINSIDWPGLTLKIKIISGILSLLFLAGIIILAVKLNLLNQAARYASEARNVSAVPKRRLTKKWEAIKYKLSTGEEANLKLAVIEADKMLDNLLERMGYHGKSMGERLEQINVGQFPRINEIWEAHKIRNNIVHDSDFTLRREDAEKAIKTYEAVLEDLEAI